MYTLVKGYALALHTFGRDISIYELIDANGKFGYAIDDYDNKKSKKRIKVMDKEFNEVYTKSQISKEKFLKLKILALEQELHRQELLTAQYQRYNEEKKDLIEKIKSLVKEQKISELKELLEEEV